jgi:hypothetical protein
MKGIDWDMVGSCGTTGGSGTALASSDIRRAVLLLAQGPTKAEVEATEAKRMAGESFIVFRLSLVDDPEFYCLLMKLCE